MNSNCTPDKFVVPPTFNQTAHQARRAFTIVEILVVISIIAVLIGIILPTLSAVRGNAARAGSMANMKQTFMLIQSYAQANRDTIVPSAFDHSTASMAVNKGKIRSETPPPTGQQYKGTWADILWTDAGFGPIAINPDAVDEYQYQYDNPDDIFYDQMPNYEKSPFRSKSALIIPPTASQGPISLDTDISSNNLGSNATLPGVPGQFAANNFFDSRYDSTAGADGFKFRKKTNHPLDATKGPYFTFGELARPEVSAYLIDSFMGETIDPVDEDGSTVRPLNCEIDPTTNTSTGQVAFRYPSDQCLILLLDGHVQSEGPWANMFQLEGGANDRKDDGTLKDPENGGDQGQGVRFRHLDLR